MVVLKKHHGHLSRQQANATSAQACKRGQDARRGRVAIQHPKNSGATAAAAHAAAELLLLASIGAPCRGRKVSTKHVLQKHSKQQKELKQCLPDQQ